MRDGNRGGASDQTGDAPHTERDAGRDNGQGSAHDVLRQLIIELANRAAAADVVRPH